MKKEMDQLIYFGVSIAAGVGVPWLKVVLLDSDTAADDTQTLLYKFFGVTVLVIQGVTYLLYKVDVFSKEYFENIKPMVKILLGPGLLFTVIPLLAIVFGVF